MSGPSGARVTGLRQTTRALERLGVETAELKDAMQHIGNKAVDDAKALAPVGKTSALVNSIRAGRAKAKATVRAGSKKTYYASFQEWGTKQITAKEFVTKAVTGNRDYAVQEIQSQLSKIIRRNNLN